jgi:archaellin
MSVVRASQIQDPTGNVILRSTGSIIQVVQTVKTNTTSIAVTANTWNEFDSSFRVTITPTSGSNKILLSAYITGAQTTGTVRYKLQYSTDNGSVFNDVTPIGDAVSNRSRGHFGYAVNSDANQFNTCPFELLHSPSTTNTLIYRIQFGQDVSTTYHFNRSVNYGDSFLGGTMTSVLIAKEVAA